MAKDLRVKRKPTVGLAYSITESITPATPAKAAARPKAKR
jgi:hypothetical protein